MTFETVAYAILSTLLRPETGIAIICALALTSLVTGICLIVRR